MTSLGEEIRQKRGPSSPLSEGEEVEDPKSRRSRMKRINLTNLAPLPESVDTDTDLLNVVPKAGGDARLDGEFVDVEQTEIIPPSKTTKTPVTLESLSEKIDHILGYLAGNKNELSIINRRHEKRLHVLESAHNDVADRLDLVNADIDSNATKIARNSTNIESNEACISTLETQLRICKATYEEYITRLKDMDLEMKNLKSNLSENRRAIVDLGMEVRERRLALSGVAKANAENSVSTALEAVNKILTHAINQSKQESKSTAARPKLRVLMLADIDNAYRVGKQKRKGPRSLIITFSFTHVRQMVFSAKKYMSTLGVKYYLNEDLTQEARDLRANLKSIAEGGKSLGYETKITGNKLVIDSETYQSDEINAISPTILHAAKRERILDDGIAFRGDRSIFSNFFPSPITIDDMDFSSVEQFFQYEKALQCEDDGRARKIMNKTNPWYIKAVGNRVELTDKWKKNLYKGIFAKFEQNIPLRQALLSTMGLKLYEATTDLFYACGIDLDSPRWSTGDWPGHNATGLMLMKVRNEFLAEESLSDSVADNSLMNLSNLEESVPLNDDQEETSIDTYVPSEAENSSAVPDEWPTVTQSSNVGNDGGNVTAVGSKPEPTPKLSKSLPQVTRTPVKKNITTRQKQTRSKTATLIDHLSEDDLAFLQVPYKNKNSAPASKRKGKGKRNQNKSTSTPANNESDRNTSSNLSPQQRAAIKDLGLPLESGYVKNIVLSQSKRK